MGFLPRFLSFPTKTYTNPKECAKVFDRAKESIKIIIPTPNINFFWDKRVIGSLERALARGVVVSVAHCENDIGKIGILSVPGISVFKLKQSYERLLVSVDAKHVIEEKAPTFRKVEVGIIVSDVASTLGHEVDTLFDELAGA